MREIGEVGAKNAAQRDAAREGQGGMTYIAKPKLHHPPCRSTRRLHPPRLRRQDLDAVRRLRPRLDLGRDHPGLLGDGHRAAPRRQAVRHRLLVEDADYFLGNSHGFNTVHGRMPSVLTGANLANRDLIYLGVSGDGDSASIGLGQFAT
jgi:2-oxoglutarate ferredoxin oxidoreductase subunit beta